MLNSFPGEGGSFEYIHHFMIWIFNKFLLFIYKHIFLEYLFYFQMMGIIFVPGGKKPKQYHIGLFVAGR